MVNPSLQLIIASVKLNELQFGGPQRRTVTEETDELKTELKMAGKNEY